MSKKVPANEPEYVVFHLEGGLGKNVAATGVVKALKQTYKNSKLIVVASWPEVFISNPNIYRVYRIGNTPYFYDNYIKDKHTLVFKHEPYFQTTHLRKQKSLIESWCDMYGLEFKNYKPELPMNMLQRDIASKWQRQKPVMVIQTNGGPLQGQKLNYSWTRDIPFPLAQALVERYSQKYHIIQVCREEGQVVPGAEGIFQPMGSFELFSILRASEKRILIDSCLQHAAAAFGLPSIVLWVGTSPVVFGHDLHTNVQANTPPGFIKLVDSYLFDYSFSGEIHECPYSDISEMFDLGKIVEAIGE